MQRPKRNARKGRERAASRPFSIAFLIAIPGNFALAAFGVISFVHLCHYSFGRSDVWALFLSGFVSALTIVATMSLAHFRVLIHEVKHAIVIVLTGNSLKNLVVKKGTGHVEFEMYENKLHFAPIISLAPYFLPLFSLPMLLVCIALEGAYTPVLALALGACLAADISFAYTDLHPHQSDLQKVPGGAFIALLYLASVHFLWTVLCLLWVLAGRSAFVYCGYILIGLLRTLAQQIAR